jgi:hypothetical protein
LEYLAMVNGVRLNPDSYSRMKDTNQH